MEVYRKSVKDVRFLKEVKRYLGQNSTSTTKEEVESEEDKANSSSSIKNEDTKSQADPLHQA